MSERRPSFDELVGGDLAPEERARLERVHDLLIAAGPPAELPPSLADRDAAAGRGSAVSFLPRRRVGAALALAAAIALVAFLGGYLAGFRHHGFATEFKVGMHGTGVAREASAVIRVGKLDAGGNWPLELEVRNLKPLPKGGYYEMFLTRKHRPAATCGTFRISGARTTVRLNAPYRFKSYDGWIVTTEMPGAKPQVVLTT